MKVNGRSITTVVVLAVVGLSAYVWFVSVLSWSFARLVFLHWEGTLELKKPGTPTTASGLFCDVE